MELNWKEDSNLIRKLAKILLGDTLPNGKPVSSIILLDDTARAELQRWANMSDAEFAAAQRSGDSVRIDVDDVIRQLEEKYALDPQLLDDLLSLFDADDLDIWEEISQWEDSDHDEPTEYFFSNPDPYFKPEPLPPDHLKHNFWFDEAGHICVKNPSAFWLPEFTLQREIGGTIYTITGSYDGTETLDRKMERILAENIFLRIRGSEKICITGKNGVGKTTLLHKIAEELLNRNDIHAEYMPQNYEELLQLHVTPVEYLDQTGKKEERTKIRTFLGALKYTADEMDHPIAELSGGQKAKIFLLKMSMSGANVLILDEPTRNFSPLSGPVIREMLKEFPGAVISISHDRKYIDEVCVKVYCLTETGFQLQEK